MGIAFLLRIFKIITYAITLSYFIGMIWMIICKIGAYEVDDSERDKYFMTYFDIDDRDN